MTDNDRPAMPAPEFDGADFLRKMFGSPRAIIDAVSGPLLFALVNARWGLMPAAIVAGGASALLAGYRLIRKQEAKQAIFGLVGSAIALGIALATKSASAYFVPGTVMTVVLGFLTLLTVALRYPMTAMFAQAIQRRPAEWYQQKDVRMSHNILTIAWALVMFARAGVRAYLIRNDRTTALGFASVLLGYPVTAAFLLGSIWFLKLRGHGGRLSEDIVLHPEQPAAPVADDAEA